MNDKSKALAAHYQHTKDCPICEQEWGEPERTPSLSPAKRPPLDTLISLRLSSEDAARIRQSATSLGMGVSDYARLMLRRAITEMERSNTFNFADATVTKP